jgi:hypothetical protein
MALAPPTVSKVNIIEAQYWVPTKAAPTIPMNWGGGR